MPLARDPGPQTPSLARRMAGGGVRVFPLAVALPADPAGAVVAALAPGRSG